MNTNRSFRGMNWKFLVILIPVLALVAVILEAAYVYTKTVSAEKQVISQVETISRANSLAVSYPLSSLDLEGLNQSLQAIVLHPEIICVEVSGVNSEERYEWPKNCTVSGNNEKFASNNLIYNNQNVGRMFLFYTTRPQRNAFKHQTLTGIIFFLLQIGGAGLAGYLALRYTVRRPVNRLIAATQKAEQSNVLETIDWHGEDELGKVVTAYNNLVNKIEENNLELIAVQEESEIAARAKNRFLANMSHELRTPLNAVIGITEMLREEAEEQHSDTEPYDRVAMSGRHLLHLVDDLLDMSKLDAGKLSLSIEEVELETLLTQVCATVQPMAASQNNNIKLNYTDIPEYIETDSLRLKQILINLLSNACKFTKNGDIVLEAAEHYFEGKKTVRFCVRDTGIGIPEDQHDQLFSEFFQIDESTSRQYGGAGLGLTISQRLCELIGGEISINSTVGQGSEFSFILAVEFEI